MGKGTGQRRPFTLGGAELVVALDDDEYERVARTGPRELGGVPVVYVRASALTDPDRQSDFYFARYVPTTPTCEQIVTYGHLGRPALFEQDRNGGAVYRAGAQVWPTAPVALWNARTGGFELVPGTDAALLFLDGERVRITTIPDTLMVRGQFSVRPLAESEDIPSDWTQRSAESLHPSAGRRS